MYTSKKWEKTGEGKYSFSVNDKVAGNMEISFNSLNRKAVSNIGRDEITIRRTGFWKSSVEISGRDGQLIAKTYNDKWYANSSILEYKDKKYKLAIRNNPLAEWVIIDNSEDLLAYGLTTDNGRVSVRITSIKDGDDYLLDFLLWYLFVPIATENSGDTFLFLMR
jgi:hypothetical protein